MTLTVVNPATEEPLAELEQAGVDEADEAVARATAASVSSTPDCSTSASGSSVAGLTTVSVTA